MECVYFNPSRVYFLPFLHTTLLLKFKNRDIANENAVLSSQHNHLQLATEPKTQETYTDPIPDAAVTVLCVYNFS